MIFLKWRREHLQKIFINSGKRLVLSGFCAGIFLVMGANAETRKLKLYYLHTGEKETIVFRKNGRLLPDGLKRANYLLRDWRRNEPTKMDPYLLDLIWEVYRESGSRSYIHVVSAYRSPATNSMLRKRGRGVARKSQHMLGKAIDFFLPDVKLAKLRKIGLIKQFGGVGYYPRSGSPFVHMDTGNVRHWPRMTRKELVKIFPHGKTLHIPADGRPLPGYELALADYNTRKLSGRKALPAKNNADKSESLFQRLASLGKRDKKSVAPSILSVKNLLPKEIRTKSGSSHNVSAENLPQSRLAKITDIPVPLASGPVLPSPDGIISARSDSQNQASDFYRKASGDKTNPESMVVPFTRPESPSSLITGSEMAALPLASPETGSTTPVSNNRPLTLSASRKLRARLITQADSQVRSSKARQNLKIALLHQQLSIMASGKKSGIRDLTKATSTGFRQINTQPKKDNQPMPDSDLVLAFAQYDSSEETSLAKLRAMIKRQNLKLTREYVKKGDVSAGEMQREILSSSRTVTDLPVTSSYRQKIKKTTTQSSPVSLETVSGKFKSIPTTDIMIPLVKPGRFFSLKTRKKSIGPVNGFMLKSNAGSGVTDKMSPPVYEKAIIHHAPDTVTATRFVYSKG